MTRVLFSSLFTRALAALCLVVLAGCGSSAKGSGDTIADASSHPGADGHPSSPVSDVPLNKDAGSPLNKDSARSEDPSPDANQVRADAASEKDAGREAAAIPADATAAIDSTPARVDSMVRDDAVPRADALAPDSVVKETDAGALACTIVTPAPPLGRLTPKELKTILDSSEDPYLINVKGSSIANIPGTDAVLASDVAGIEALVGGKPCANIIIYCRSGVTSQTVGNQLVAKGYQNVRDLSGGINAWTAAGYPTE